MSFTITSSSWFSSKTASFKISKISHRKWILLVYLRFKQDKMPGHWSSSLRSLKMQKPKRKWPISRHLDCASLVNKEFSIVKLCKLRNGILRTCQAKICQLSPPLYKNLSRIKFNRFLFSKIYSVHFSK